VMVELLAATSVGVVPTKCEHSGSADEMENVNMPSHRAASCVATTRAL